MNFSGWVPPEIKIASIAIGVLLLAVAGLSFYAYSKPNYVTVCNGESYWRTGNGIIVTRGVVTLVCESLSAKKN